MFGLKNSRSFCVLLSLSSALLVVILATMKVAWSFGSEYLKETDNETIEKNCAPGEYSIMGSFEHDRSAFTQGLVFYNGYLYESTGLHGQSLVKKLDPTTGKALLSSEVLPRQHFGEGIAILNGKVYQITWLSGGAGFIYSADTLQKIGEFKYQTTTGEGWGLTTDGHSLIASDGSENLHFWDPDTFEVLRTVQVFDPVTQSTISQLNELEYVDGFILANVWHQDFIIKINQDTGIVEDKYTFDELLPFDQRINLEAVLNGIAYDPENGVAYITGKLWPKMFTVKFGQTP